MIEKLRIRLLDRENPVRIHLIGVAGSGMSGLARMLLEMGHRVSGCDRVTSAETENLQRAGLSFSSPHNEGSVQDAEIVIYSSAIREDNVALAAARANGASCLRRAECLAAILNNKRGVIVAGTHGKTTTSSLITHLLRESRQRPCHYVGAEIPVLGSNAHWNEQSEYLIAEGDESDGTLVNYLPEHSIVLNIEAEHLDFYRDIDHIKEVFHILCRNTKDKIFYCKSDEVAHQVCSQYPSSVSYGWEDADYTVDEMSVSRGRTHFTILQRGEILGRVELGIPGRHNVLNALGAVAVALEMGGDFAAIAKGLTSFAGAKRRFETKYLSRNYHIVDDYGHHPTELAATLQTARSLAPKRLIVLFQPHRYTRTQLLRDDFGACLQDLDRLVVTDIYPASELPIEGITGQTIIDAVREQGSVKCKNICSVRDAQLEAGNRIQPGDLVITLGAGNIHEAGTKLARDLRLIAELLQDVGEQELDWKLYEPMRKHTTLRIGGAAQYWIEPHSIEALRGSVNFFKDRGIPVYVIGRGSNLLVRDGGIRGAVIRPKGAAFEHIERRGDFLTVGSAVPLAKLARTAQSMEITGFEWMGGIPGNVGGSLRQNAGAMGRDMWSVFSSALCIDENGELVTFEKETMKQAEYRLISEFSRNIVVEANFVAKPDELDSIKARAEQLRDKRRSSQPNEPSAGCTFTNPTDDAGVTHPAGKLIDELGLKGHRIGDAVISPVHANFIVNVGEATAQDVTQLIDLIIARVKEAYDITLRTEVQIIGEREADF